MQKSKPDSNPTLSIIVPVFRDNDALLRCLSHPAHTSLLPSITVVLGEPDTTAEALCARYNVRCLLAHPAGRANQMNHGAGQANGDVLLFLHADTLLPVEAAPAVQQAVADGALGGGFSRKFEHRSKFLSFTCRLADWRGKTFGWLLGDQAIFVRRSVFMRIGGFPHWPQFEDLELSRRLRRTGKTVLLHPRILSSARRFEQRGPVRQTLVDAALTIGYLIRSKCRQ